MNWEKYFKSIAEVVKTKSKDTSTNIGAVIVNKENSIISTGYNSFPRGMDDNKAERYERPEKYYWFEHAERNAIYNAARIGVSTNGCTMYLTCWSPCTDCARAIIQSGIKTIYLTALHRKDAVGVGGSNPAWDEHSVRSLEMFKEAGIEVKIYKK